MTRAQLVAALLLAALALLFSARRANDPWAALPYPGSPFVEPTIRDTSTP